MGTRVYDEPVGILKVGAIQSFDPNTLIMRVKLSSDNSLGFAAPLIVTASFPVTMSNGLFMGALPAVGTPVVIAQVSGGEAQYAFVSYLPQNLDQVPSINQNELVLHANELTTLTLNKNSNDIYIGYVDDRLHINAARGLITSNFNNQQSFTEASRNINGTVKRDKILAESWDLNSRLKNDDYDPLYTLIGLDPTLTANSVVAGSNKNPPFVEQREIVYEFQDSSFVKDELSESLLYAPAGSSNILYSYPNRRKSKADTLSLTLASPNYLIETVKGTVVDIFGNLLDINRAPILVGTGQNTLDPDISTNKVESYKKIRELQRKTLAFHFEINARKDFTQTKDFTSLDGTEDIPGNIVPTNSDIFGYNEKFPNADYGRLRSRFFFDVDKEGQFKLNIPASSNKGNVSLLTRYENWTNLSPEDNNNPDKLIFRNDLLDILQDSFAAPKLDLDNFLYADTPGVIPVLDGNADATPLDRRYDGYVHIKHGTAFHDITSTCYAHQKNTFMQYQNADPANPPIDVDAIPLLTNLVQDKLYISGDSANVGGRSGVINLDGSIEMNIGANSSDRQSIWLDTAGGMVANIGRDLNNRSAVMAMNGDVIIQVGGIGVVGDSRFIKQQNGQIGAVVDLRVFNDGLTVTMLRIDNNGVTLMTPGNLNIYASKDIKITGASLDINVENCTIQGRLVNKGTQLDSI